jgi:uncharacterized membrane protein
MRLKWNQRYLLKSYLRSSLWIVPLISIPIALVCAKALHRLDMRLDWNLLDFEIAGAKSLLEAFVSAALAFVVFTFGSLLVAIQIASAQMTPRIIATLLLRDDVVKYTVGFLTFTLMFALSAQNTLDEDLHQLLLLIAILLGILSFAAFFYLIDYASRMLRPITVLTRIGDNGIAVVESVYPEPSLGPVKESAPPKPPAPDRVISHQGTSGIVLAVNVQRLVALAEGSDGVVEFVPQVGDFVAVDDPLFNLFGGAAPIDEDILRASVAFGSERTMEQDPTFAFRIAVDIALKALSPAINDPTTAVLAIDQLHRMLRTVGRRELRTDEILNRAGKLRVVFRTPNWEDFVQLAFREIRACGSNNLQIARRLRAMIENLARTLPAYRHPALLQELSLLDRDIAKNFAYPEDVALARVADTQGLGAHSGTAPRGLADGSRADAALRGGT